MTHSEIAEVIHTVILCQAGYLEDRKIKSWNGITDDDRKMYTDAVKWIQENSVLPHQVHDFWVERMQAMGWIFGVEKNNLLKTHPGLVPYEQLSDYEKAKDILFMTLAKIL